MSAWEIVRNVHIALGALALVAFWSAGLARKGSPVHLASGKVYLLAMAVLLVAAVPLTIRLGLRGVTHFAWFLGYLLLITATACWTAWRAIRDRRDWARYTGPVYRVLAALNLAGGVAIAVLGLRLGNPVFMIFSLPGLIGGAAMLRFTRRAPADPRWWLRQHLGAMTANGVATHIAFLSIGLPKLLPMWSGPTLQMLAWVGPLAIATLARVIASRRHGFTQPATTAADATRTASPA